MSLQLIYPGLGGDHSKGSYITHAEAPGLTTRDMEFYMNIRSAGQDKTGDPTYAPLHDTDFTNLADSHFIAVIIE